MSEGALLAVDVGGGTQDIFLWEPGQAVENAVKMVLPAPTQIIARRLRRLTEAGRAVFLTGRLMGGGPITSAVRRHLAQGLAVYASPQAALTLHDNIDMVKQWGVSCTDSPPPEAAPLVLGDVDLEALRAVLTAFEVPWPSHFAVAVQDHGFSPQASNREFRFQYWREVLARGGNLADLAFGSRPHASPVCGPWRRRFPGFSSWTPAPRACGGPSLTPRPGSTGRPGSPWSTSGNAHTFAALIREERVFGIYEHHTGMLTPGKLCSTFEPFSGRRP